MRINRETFARLVTRVQTTAELAQGRACTITASPGRLHVSAVCDTHAITVSDHLDPAEDAHTWQPASVNAGALLGVLSAISSPYIDAGLDGTRLHIRHEDGAVWLAVVRTQEPPSSEHATPVATVSGAILRRAIGLVRYAEQRHGDRATLDGTHIAIGAGSVTVSASNGQSAAAALIKDIDAEAHVPAAVLFPVPAAARVLCEMTGNWLHVSRVSAGWLLVDDVPGDEAVFIRQHTAEFPCAGLEKLVETTEHWPAYTIDAAELRAAMQVCAAASDRSEAPVDVWQVSSGLHLRTLADSAGRLGEVTGHHAHATRDDDGERPDIDDQRPPVAVDARKVVAALGTRTGPVRVSLPVDPLDCIVIEDTLDGAGLLRHVIMPMRRK